MRQAKDDLIQISEWMMNPQSIPLDGRIASVINNMSKSDKMKAFKSVFAIHQAKRMSKLIDFLENIEGRMITHQDIEELSLEQLIKASSDISKNIKDAYSYVQNSESDEINTESEESIGLDLDQRKRVRGAVNKLLEIARIKREEENE